MTEHTEPDFKRYTEGLQRLREAAIAYSRALGGPADIPRHQAWHELLVAARTHAAAHTALLGRFEAAPGHTPDPKPTPTGVSHTHCIK